MFLFQNLIKPSLHVPQTAFLQFAKDFHTSFLSATPISLGNILRRRKKRTETTNSPETVHRERKTYVFAHIPAPFPDTIEMIPHSPALPYSPLSPSSCCHT